MLDTLLEYAKSDENIRAVLLNGSLVNEKVKPDPYQDIDIIFAVTDFDKRIKDDYWLEGFGKKIMMQKPDQLDFDRGLLKAHNDRYAYLILFEDGLRVDLTLVKAEAIETVHQKDSLSKILLDKDSRLTVKPINDTHYLIRPFSDATIYAHFNNIIWCSQNVLKGILREEWPYALSMVYKVMMENVDELVKAYVALNHDDVNIGAFNKWMKYFVPGDLYEDYLALKLRPEKTEAIYDLLHIIDYSYKLTALIHQTDSFEGSDDYHQMKRYIKRFIK